MRYVAKLMESLADEEFTNSAQLRDRGTKKNILFISPQLCSKDLYRMIIPYFGLLDEEGTCGTAVTNFDKFNPSGHLLQDDFRIPDNMIWWASHIVFPFTTKDLSSYYERIRKINHFAKVVYLIDFNYYELSQKHPYYSVINEPGCIDRIETNIIRSDIVMLHNKPFYQYLINKLRQKYEQNKQLEASKCVVSIVPYVMDTLIMCENVNYDPQIAEHIIPRNHAKDVTITSDKQKKINPKKSKVRRTRKSILKPPKKHSGKHSGKKDTGKKEKPQAQKQKPKRK